MINSSKKREYTKQSGFTLVELLVSLSIFTIVIVIAIGTLIVVIDANRKAQAINISMTNVSFVVDNMTRNIRTGYNYFCDDEDDLGGNGSPLSPGPNEGRNDVQDCDTGDTGIVFTDGEDPSTRIGFRLRTDGIWMKKNLGNWILVAGGELEIDAQSMFTVTGTNAGDGIQPTVNILIKGNVFDKGLPTSFSIQTEVVQRILDF